MLALPPLADLHRHLDGSIRAQTIRELAQQKGIKLPSDLQQLQFYPGMGLQEALGCFATMLSLLNSPEAVHRVAHEICEDASQEGVTCLEIRFAPQLHGELTPEVFVDAAIEGIDNRAGLILCGLYGEPPAILELLLDIAATRPNIVGIDLAGCPVPEHQFHLKDYAPAYRRARDMGLGTTVHASEGRPPQEIRVAIEELGANRIGHGTTILEDPAIVDLALENDITIEACPTSNMQTGVISSVDEHPMAKWLQAGLRVCISPDNTFFSNTDAQREHQSALSIHGMTPDLLHQAITHGHRGAFRRS